MSDGTVLFFCTECGGSVDASSASSADHRRCNDGDYRCSDCVARPKYKNDIKWLTAWTEYIREKEPNESANHVVARRDLAIRRMHLIERQYELGIDGDELLTVSQFIEQFSILLCDLEKDLL